MAVRFIDANIFLRAITESGDGVQTPASQALLNRLSAGTEKVTTSSLVLFEVIFTLHRTYKQPKERVAHLLTRILEPRSFQLSSKQEWYDALAVWLEYPIDFTDAYNVVQMRLAGISEIYAWDKGYDYVKDINRIEPSDAPTEEAA